MPTYTFEDTKTKEIFDKYLSMADRETYLEENPHIKQKLLTPPSLDGSGRIGQGKPDAGFRDVLKNIKSHHPGSRSIKNTINDW
jgi:hypothetical protein